MKNLTPPASEPLPPVAATETASRLVLTIRGQQVPCFKNRKRAIRLRNGKLRTLTEPKIKKRMHQLEDAILSALYSTCPISAAGTHLECWKQSRTLLLNLLDDSVKEIPRGSWDVEYVKKGMEGCQITIEQL